MKKEKGITLIALVITIIVLLILAVVSIAMLTGENGILGKATSARTITKDEEGREKVELAYNGVRMQHLSEGKDSAITTQELQTELDKYTSQGETTVSEDGTSLIVTYNDDSGRKYSIDNNYNEGKNSEFGKVEVIKTDSNAPQTKEWVKEYKGEVPIPIGFDYVEGTGIDTNKGLVIKSSSTLDSYGNEFVWVPVVVQESDTKNNVANLKRWYTDKYNLTTDTTKTFSDDTSSSEYKAMVSSVYKYKGFYIARYEATYKSGGDACQASYTDEEKKALIATSIPAKSLTIADNMGAVQTDGQEWINVNAIGAINASKNMYPQSNQNSGGLSHLIYGVQWDTTLKYLVDSGAINQYQLTTNAGTWGIYTPSTTYETPNPIKTGSSNATKKNNIYDMAGNFSEYIQERVKLQNDTAEIVRYSTAGGYYQTADKWAYPTIRNFSMVENITKGTSTTNAQMLSTFRSAMFIKE